MPLSALRPAARQSQEVIVLDMLKERAVGSEVQRPQLQLASPRLIDAVLASSCSMEHSVPFSLCMVWRGDYRISNQ